MGRATRDGRTTWFGPPRAAARPVLGGALAVALALAAPPTGLGAQEAEQVQGEAAGVPITLTVTGGLEAERVASASLLLRAEGEAIETVQDLIAAARADYTRIVGRLYSLGYYGPVVSILIDGREAAELAPFDAPERIGRVEVRVQSGPLFLFGRAAIGPLAEGTEIPPEFAPGEEARTGVVRQAAAAALAGWRDVGRPKAEVGRQSIVARQPDARLDVGVAIEPGRLATFGALDVEGAERVRERRIRAIAGFPTGEVFDPDEVERVLTRLRRTGAFRAVALEEGEAINPDGTLDATLTVIEELPRRFGFGAEVGTDEGLSLEAFWMHRNLLGGAERLRFEGEVDGIGAGGEEQPDYRLTARFERPATFDADTDLSLLAEVERLDEPSFMSDILRLEAGVVRYATDDLTLRAAVQLRFSDVEDDLGERSFQHVSFPLQATQDKRDDRLNPTGGYFADVTATPFVGLGDSRSGGRLFADGRLYRGLGAEDRVVLAGRVQAGSVLGTEIEETPPDYLFFSGGGGTVRGQPFESLNVMRPSVMRPGEEDEFGGRSFLGLQGEVRVAVTDKIGAVGFFDAGLIGDESFGGETESHTGAGLGVRYDTGIGPIRFDLATPVSGDTGEGVQFYLGIGQAF